MVLALAALCVNAKDEQRTVYIFGLSASFNDSTVYFTPVEKLDSAWIESKTGFLKNRQEYSYQLRDYMKTQGVKNPTGITFFSFDKKKIDKKYQKVMSKYTGKKAKNHYFVRELSGSDFVFRPVDLNGGTQIIVGK